MLKSKILYICSEHCTQMHIISLEKVQRQMKQSSISLKSKISVPCGFACWSAPIGRSVKLAYSSRNGLSNTTYFFLFVLVFSKISALNQTSKVSFQFKVKLKLKVQLYNIGIDFILFLLLSR